MARQVNATISVRVRPSVRNSVDGIGVVTVVWDRIRRVRLDSLRLMRVRGGSISIGIESKYSEVEYGPS